MRSIGILFDQEEVKRFSGFLEKTGIEHRVEIATDKTIGKRTYQIWIVDEDQIELAIGLLQKFRNNPLHADFNPVLGKAPLSKREKKEPLPSRNTPVTFFFLVLCILIYIFNAVQEKENSAESAQFTPIQLALLYDVPTSPSFSGYYDFVVLKLLGHDPFLNKTQLFEKLQQKEVWRLFSPCVLHTQFFHLLFNMLWLWTLSRPIEQRIGSLRILILIVTIGIISNTAQYLMSGPYFLGYSGVILGFSGFIWRRQRRAPWEAYPIHRSTFVFLMIFILVMLLLQVISFLVQILMNVSFVLVIANTAHLAGAFVGAFLARFSFFARRLS